MSTNKAFTELFKRKKASDQDAARLDKEQCSADKMAKDLKASAKAQDAASAHADADGFIDPSISGFDKVVGAFKDVSYEEVAKEISDQDTAQYAKQDDASANKSEVSDLKDLDKDKADAQLDSKEQANLKKEDNKGKASAFKSVFTKRKVKDSSDLKVKTKGKAAKDSSEEPLKSTVDPKVYPVIVYTAQELEEAHKNKAERIVVKGELAKKLHTAFKGLRSLSMASLNTLGIVLGGAALFAPFTGGVSLGAAGTVMGTVGAALTATAIAAISAIGLALVIAVFKGYDEVKLAGGGMELVIKKGKVNVQESEPKSDDPKDTQA